ncbi:MAG: hypothetical protein INH41_13550 [Myxococcaceae bacterium]|nr:hypothetical protein [Myxococcaceae bacterium]
MLAVAVALVMAAPEVTPMVLSEREAVARANEAFAASQQSFQQGRDAEAAARFEAARADTPSPLLVFNSGR